MSMNGILNVSASDKGTGNTEKITITNDKGRLSQEEIERMVQEAEQYAEEDKKVKEKIDARNEFESYVYSIKSSLSEDKWKGKIDEEEKETVDEAVKEALEWLDDNQDAEKEDFDEKKSKLTADVTEIMTKFASAGGGASSEDKADEDEDDDDEDEL